jgi:hypothetical protein
MEPERSLAVVLAWGWTGGWERGVLRRCGKTKFESEYNIRASVDHASGAPAAPHRRGPPEAGGQGGGGDRGLGPLPDTVFRCSAHPWSFLWQGGGRPFKSSKISRRRDGKPFRFSSQFWALRSCAQDLSEQSLIFGKGSSARLATVNGVCFFSGRGIAARGGQGPHKIFRPPITNPASAPRAGASVAGLAAPADSVPRSRHARAGFAMICAAFDLPPRRSAPASRNFRKPAEAEARRTEKTKWVCGAGPIFYTCRPRLSTRRWWLAIDCMDLFIGFFARLRRGGLIGLVRALLADGRGSM